MPKGYRGRIFEYFIVCGIKPIKGLTPFQTGVSYSENESTDLRRLVSPLQQTYVPAVLKYYPAKDVNGRLDFQAITTLCFPHGVSLYEHVPTESVKFHPFIITKENGSKVHAAALTFYEKIDDEKVIAEMNGRLKDFHRDLQRTNVGRLSGFRPLEQLYSAKSICFILSQPFNRAAEDMLRHIYTLAMTAVSSQLPLESYIYNLLYEVPLPSPGRSTRFYCNKRSITCYRPGVEELPILDYPLATLIQQIGISKLVSVFNCAMLEHRILVKSNDYYRLMLVCECITSLLFPFMWAHVYVPILPASRLDFLDAPVPFIMGVCKADTDNDEDEEIAACERCTIDIDTGKVECPEDIPLYPHTEDLMEEIKQLCIKYGVKVKHHEGDNDSGMSSEEGSLHSSTDISSESHKKTSEQFTSSRLAELEAIAKKAGVIFSVDDITNEVLTENKRRVADDHKKQQDQNKAKHNMNMLKFSECVREVFFHCQLQLFAHYEKFVIYPAQCDMSTWLYNDFSREVQNFDKEAFLGDQHSSYQPFLCSFLETQMFATFVDHKIMSQWMDPEQSIRVFDTRNLKANDSQESSNEDQLRTSYEKCDTLEDTDALVEKRMRSSDYVALAPHILEGLDTSAERGVYNTFPDLDVKVLTQALPDEETEEEALSSPELGRRSRHTSESSSLPTSKPDLTRKPSLALDRQPSAINDTYLHFVSTLLKECKTKTNRMLVGKMGEEAVQLGHSDPTLLGLEENTMIANLCDLLERIWSHGLLQKKSKSPLWAHLSAYAISLEMTHRNKQVDTFTAKQAEAGALTAVLFSAGMKLLYDLTAPGLVETGDIAIDVTLTPADSEGQHTPPMSLSPSDPHETDVGNLLPTEAVEKTLTHRRKGSYPERLQMLQPLSDKLITDIRHVQEMQEIKTDVGRARAFIRLSLEKKLLAKHLKELMYNHDLLKDLYKRTAFLRSDDEREQALFHLLSLNTADYLCFTNAFTSTMIAYRVLIIPGKRFAGGISTTTANVWISVAGQLHDSDRKWLPKNCMDFTFESKNLGQLSTVRIGHDNSGLAPKWLVDNVLVRNETTGQIVKFTCGRWLGRGVDDDSTERILVGETISFKAAEVLLDNTHNSPRRQKDSPKITRKPSEIKNCKTQMQQRLSDSVNNLLKYFHKPEKERESVTLLLCGENGLVTRLEEMLSMGFKSTRLFRSNLYIWDYLENVLRHIMSSTAEPCRSFVANLTIINNSLQDVGKDGKLQLLLCLAVRDHLLPEWLHFLHKCPITRQMYEDSSFLLDEPQIQFLINLLSTLRTYHIQLEPSITKGLDI